MDIKLFNRDKFVPVKAFHFYGVVGADCRAMTAFHAKADGLRGNKGGFSIAVFIRHWDMSRTDMAANTTSLTQVLIDCDCHDHCLSI